MASVTVEILVPLWAVFANHAKTPLNSKRLCLTFPLSAKFKMHPVYIAFVSSVYLLT